MLLSCCCCRCHCYRVDVTDIALITVVILTSILYNIKAGLFGQAWIGCLCLLHVDVDHAVVVVVDSYGVHFVVVVAVAECCGC